MKRDDRIYTAALVDGEGSVTLTKHQGNEHRFPGLTVPSTTYVFMAFLKRTFGGHISTKKRYKKTYSKSWVWAVRTDRALRVLSAIVPFMKEPEKVRRINLLLKYYKKVTPRNGKYTAKLLKEKKKFESRFFLGSRKVMGV